MATSKTHISNLALSMIGEDVILDINDVTNDAAQKCKLHYKPTAKEVMRAANWNCLKKRIQLASNPTPAFEWEYSYTQPVECVRVVRVNGISPGNSYAQSLYEIEGRDILTNSDECKLQYIEYTDDVTVFDALLDRAIITLFASRLASIIPGDDELSLRLLDVYTNEILPQAKLIDAKEKHSRRFDPIAQSSFLASRRIQPSETVTY
jgi:hypothetical protein